MTTMQTFGKVTLYYKGEMTGGMVRVEARSATIEVQPYAQWENGIKCTFVPKGARSERLIIQTTYPSLVVLDGWGHPAPDGVIDPATAKVATSGPVTVTTSMGRYSSCDPRWAGDLATKLEAHVASTGARIVADYRGHVVAPRVTYAAPTV